MNHRNPRPRAIHRSGTRRARRVKSVRVAVGLAGLLIALGSMNASSTFAQQSTVPSSAGETVEADGTTHDLSYCQGEVAANTWCTDFAYRPYDYNSAYTPSSNEVCAKFAKPGRDPITERCSSHFAEVVFNPAGDVMALVKNDTGASLNILGFARYE